MMRTRKQENKLCGKNIIQILAIMLKIQFEHDLNAFENRILKKGIFEKC